MISRAAVAGAALFLASAVPPAARADEVCANALPPVTNAVAVCVIDSAGASTTCWISTVQTLDPINASWDVYVSYRGRTNCVLASGAPYPMAWLDIIVAPQHCRLFDAGDPTSSGTCTPLPGNYGSNSSQHELTVETPGGAVRCDDCKGDIVETETLHRLKLIEGRFAAGSAECRYTPDLTFAECETRDVGTTWREWEGVADGDA